MKSNFQSFLRLAGWHPKKETDPPPSEPSLLSLLSFRSHSSDGEIIFRFLPDSIQRRAGGAAAEDLVKEKLNPVSWNIIWNCNFNTGNPAAVSACSIQPKKKVSVDPSGLAPLSLKPDQEENARAQNRAKLNYLHISQLLTYTSALGPARVRTSGLSQKLQRDFRNWRLQAQFLAFRKIPTKFLPKGGVWILFISFLLPILFYFQMKIRILPGVKKVHRCAHFSAVRSREKPL